jgi:hypothetical protein
MHLCMSGLQKHMINHARERGHTPLGKGLKLRLACEEIKKREHDVKKNMFSHTSTHIAHTHTNTHTHHSKGS